jgi:hypothetical protein
MMLAGFTKDDVFALPLAEFRRLSAYVRLRTRARNGGPHMVMACLEVGESHVFRSWRAFKDAEAKMPLARELLRDADAVWATKRVEGGLQVTRIR